MSLAPIESTEELVAFLRSGEKPPERFRVGTEHEKIGLYEDGDHARVPYEGERGIGRLLDRHCRGRWLGAGLRGRQRHRAR